MPSYPGMSWRVVMARSFLIWLAACVFSAVLVLGVTAWYCKWAFGSLEVAARCLRGQRVMLSPRTVDLGAAAPGTIKEAEFYLINMKSAPLTLTGASSSCSCVAVTTELPKVVQAGERAALRLRVAYPSREGPFVERFQVFTDDPEYLCLDGAVAGRVNK